MAEFEGRPLTFLNSVVSAPDGSVYFTQSSQRWARPDWPLVFLEARPDGRLFRMHTPPHGTPQLQVLADGMFFPNGVALAADSALIVAESGPARVLRFELDPSTNATVRRRTVLLENLPGIPDNLQPLCPLGALRGGREFLLAMAAGRSRLLDVVQPHARTKRVLGALLPVHQLRHLAPKRGWLLHFDVSGRVLGSYEDHAGKQLGMVSDALPLGDAHLLVGSVVNGFLALAPLPAALRSHACAPAASPREPDVALRLER